MSSWGAFYQRVLDATAFHGEPLVEVTFEPPDLAEDSCGCEVIAIQTEDTSDVFVYDHWRDGVLARGLSYTMDGGFHRASGVPDGWEASVFAVPVSQGSIPYTTLDTIMTAVETYFRLPHVR